MYDMSAQVNTHHVVVWTEVFEMAEAGDTDADKDGDAQDHQGEQRYGAPETSPHRHAHKHIV